MIPLSSIVPDPGYQPRGDGFSTSHLAMLAESDPAKWPPLTVAPCDDGRYVLIDGFHRFEIATRRKLDALPCVVLEGAGYAEAVFANITHGLPLSRADRKDAARWWANEEPGLSYREIGRRVGLSDKTVAAAIRDGEPSQPSRSTPDPVARLVSSLLRTQADHAPSARSIRREIDAYANEHRADVAATLAAIGGALIEASRPFMERG